MNISDTIKEVHGFSIAVKSECNELDYTKNVFAVERSETLENRMSKKGRLK
jgi:hypothetical protein